MRQPMTGPACQFCHIWMSGRHSGITSRAGFEECRPRKRSRQSTMTEHFRISLAPDVLVGKPVIRGTRLSVESNGRFFSE